MDQRLLPKRLWVFKYLFLTLFLQLFYIPPLLAETAAFAIEKVITGTVIDESGEGIPGANIRIKDTTIGTVTDLDGTYTVTVPNDEAVLVFSFIGLTTQEEVVGNRTVINVQLAADMSGLDEVVVVGFGTQKKESVVGAMSSINPSELKIPASNLTTALAGRVAGLVAYQTSGEPGKDNAQLPVR